jgi:nucleoside-diphosphate-sugar epimerase/predicted dehydrogenase
MSNPLKCLIIGGGAVVREYYIPALAYLNLLDSVTIVEPDPKAVALLRSAGIQPIELRYQDFFTQLTDVYDFAIITLPNHLHENAIELCLERQINVLCEKPLSLSSEACAHIQAFENKSAAKVYTGMVRRYIPSFKALKNSLHLVGELQSVDVEDGNPYAWIADTYAVFDPKNGGVLADMGVHYLDLLYNLFGKLTAASYVDDEQGGVEANCTYHLETANQIPIQLKLSRTHSLKNKFVISGSNGKLWMEKDDFACCFFEGKDQTTHQIKLNEGFTDSKLNYVFEACFIEQLTCLFEHDSNLVNVKEATDVVSLIEWAYQNRKQKVIAKKGDQPYWITGGTGFIGSALINRLWNNGLHSITAPVRSYKNCAAIARFKIDLPRLDLLNYEAVKESLKDKKFIVHLAYSTDGANAYELNVTATQNVVRAACEQGAAAVVVLSTMNVYGFPDGEVTESSPQNPAGGDYGKTKKIMQEWCLKFAKTQSKTRIVLLNPTCVYGPDGKTYTTLPLVLAKNNRFCWVDEGKGLANIVYIENLLDAIEKALITEAAHGQNFIISDGTLTWKAFLTPLLGELASHIPSLTKDELLKGSFNEKSDLKQIVRFLLSNFELVSLINAHPFLGRVKKNLFAKMPGVRGKLDDQRQIVWSAQTENNLIKQDLEKFNPPAWLDELFGYTNSKFSATKAQEILGWKPTVTTEQGIENTKKWLASSFR